MLMTFEQRSAAGRRDGELRRRDARRPLDPETGGFIRTDVMGTHVLLEAVRRHQIARFLQVSTDEVYGEHRGERRSEDRSDPAAQPLRRDRRPAATSQALAYHATFETPVLVTRGSNTYGPYQYPEKLIPLFVTNLLEGERVPSTATASRCATGSTSTTRARHRSVLSTGRRAEVYNLAGGNSRTEPGTHRGAVRADWTVILSSERAARHGRPGHDRRYAIDARQGVRRSAGRRSVASKRVSRETVAWYRAREDSVAAYQVRRVPRLLPPQNTSTRGDTDVKGMILAGGPRVASAAAHEGHQQAFAADLRPADDLLSAADALSVPASERS